MGDPRLDWKKTAIVMGVIFVIYMFVGTREELYQTLLVLPGLVLALTVHEYSHARMADRLGDPTPEAQGRITLNPFAHLDIAGTICLLLAGFGWGKPVQVNPTYYRNPARDNMLVAFAGPLSNFILAFIMFLIFPFAYYFVPLGVFNETLTMIIVGAAYINLTLGVFNLLPVPPLDGSKILAYFLKGNARKFLWWCEKYSTIIILLLFISGLPAKIVGPLVGYLSDFMLSLVETIIGPLL